MLAGAMMRFVQGRRLLTSNLLDVIPRRQPKLIPRRQPKPKDVRPEIVPLPRYRFGMSRPEIMPRYRFGMHRPEIMPRYRFGMPRPEIMPRYRFDMHRPEIMPRYRFDMPRPEIMPWYRFDMPRPEIMPWYRFDMPRPEIMPWYRFDMPRPEIMPWYRFDMPMPEIMPWYRFDMPMPEIMPWYRFDMPMPEFMPRYRFGMPRPRYPFGMARHPAIVMQTIELMQNLSPDEKLKYGFIFSELLDLPKPPEPEEESTKGTGDKFAVKLVKFDPEKKSNVLREVAWVKSTEKVIKDLYELGMGPSREALKNVPSVIKEGVSKEEANEIIAKIEAVGGVAVMEPLE